MAKVLSVVCCFIIAAVFFFFFLRLLKWTLTRTELIKYLLPLHLLLLCMIGLFLIMGVSLIVGRYPEWICLTDSLKVHLTELCSTNERKAGLPQQTKAQQELDKGDSSSIDNTTVEEKNVPIPKEVIVYTDENGLIPLRIKVLDKDDGIPIDSAMVEANVPISTPRKRYTDSNGMVIIRFPKSRGPVKLWALKPGYNSGSVLISLHTLREDSPEQLIYLTEGAEDE